MTSPLTGLSALAGYQVQIDADSQATPEERMGGTADPAHGQYLAEPSIPRGSRIGPPHGPFGPENQLLSDEFWFMEGGGQPDQDPDFDYTPNTHAGPWPKGILSGANTGDVGPDATASRLAQSYALHSLDKNAKARLQTDRAFALNDEWQTVEQLNPGSDTLQEVPKQAKSGLAGWGTTDRRQSMERQNEFGFDSAHQHRRFAVGSIPGNTMWMRPGGRPLVKSFAGPARPPIGENSPFTGQDLGQTFGIDGAVLQNVPTEYVPPAQPNLAVPVTYPGDNDSYVEWY